MVFVCLFWKGGKEKYCLYSFFLERYLLLFFFFYAVESRSFVLFSR